MAISVHACGRRITKKRGVNGKATTDHPQIAQIDAEGYWGKNNNDSLTQRRKAAKRIKQQAVNLVKP